MRTHALFLDLVEELIFTGLSQMVIKISDQGSELCVCVSVHVRACVRARARVGHNRCMNIPTSCALSFFTPLKHKCIYTEVICSILQQMERAL